MDANTTGSAQHKIKTINVEVNMLDAWALQRVELEGKVLRKLGLLSGILITAVAMIPFLWGLNADRGRNLESSQMALATSQQKRGELERHAKEVAPGLKREETIVRCQQYSKSVIDELTKVINAAPDGMYFDQLEANITGGQCSIKVDANAITAAVGRSFIDSASKGSNVLLSGQTSIRQNKMSEAGIEFDYLKKVGL
ncbi:MAG: hypothetical protein JST51_07430 [Armatimonadetes bacterium]|nr:hypothetical protein [Armatimonadota bacterium]